MCFSDVLPEVGMSRIGWWDLARRREEPPAHLGVEIFVAPDPGEDPGFLSNIDVLIAEARDIRDPEVNRAVVGLLSLSARPPVLLLTSPDPDNVRFLKDLIVEDLAWTSEPENEVVARAARLARVTERRRVAEHLLRSCPDCQAVEKAIKEMFLGQSPISRVQDLAKKCLVSPRALERKWKESRPEHCPATLKALLDWALLLRAWELSHLGVPPHEIPKALGVHDRTLGRLGYRLSGLSCKQFFRLKGASVRRLVDRELLR